MITNKDLPNKFNIYYGDKIVQVYKQQEKFFADDGEKDYLIIVDGVGEALLSERVLLLYLNSGDWKVEPLIEFMEQKENG